MTLCNAFDYTLCDMAKWAFTTRRVRRADVANISGNFAVAQAGDLILCEVVEIGQHKKIQLAERRTSAMYPGDLVVLCVGDRYAPDQFLSRASIGDGFVALAAGGGVCGEIEAAHLRMEEPTRLRPIGLLLNRAGSVINVADYALPAMPADNRVTVFGVFGASMNSGKTTAAASLAHGLRRAGYSTVGVKATGTGAFGDYNAFEDAGVAVMDFTDVGMATTYRAPMERIARGFDTLIGTAAQAGADVVVVEFADGVFQQETRAILQGSRIRDRLDGLLFAAPDALGAMGGVAVLERYGLSPFAISGMLTLSPLATQEALEITGLPILSRDELWDPAVISRHASSLMRANKSQVAA